MSDSDAAMEDAVKRILYLLPGDDRRGMVCIAGEVTVSSQLLDQAIRLNRAIREWRPPAYPLVWEGDQA